MLHVERSNRTERLFEGLAARLMAPGRDPLLPSTVVVQGPGMERWLAQSIARMHGVCANTRFLFPRAFLEEVFAEVEGVPAPSPGLWDSGALTWALARELAAHREDPDFAPLALHLGAEDGDWRLVQLAAEIAGLLDRYAAHRPRWLQDWAAGRAIPHDRDARWQARLVQALAAASEDRPLADRALRVLRALERPDRAERLERAWPRGIEVFAVSTLLPVDLAILDRLACIVDVRLSILSPSRQWWADLWQEVREADREGLSRDDVLSLAPRPVEPIGEPPSEAGRLLASLGRLGADFQTCLEEPRAADKVDLDHFVVPAGETMLAKLQRSFLDLAPPEAGERTVADDDASIEVHLCHGPRRELEVVHARLQAAFRSIPDLAPEDVIVMAPKIDDIAPEIEAVFGALREEDGAIPHRIADRGAMRRSPVAESFVALLELLTGRGARGEVLDWLAREPVRDRFGIDAEAVEEVADWAARAGVRFGLDAEHRRSLDLEADPAHTWSDALARLALAHAIGTRGDVHCGRTAAPIGPMADANLLGALGDLEDLLRRAREQAGHPRPVAAWCDWLAYLLEDACSRDDANAHEHLRIRTQLRELAASSEAAGFDHAIPFEAIRERVVAGVTANPAPQAFLSGGVTFCELVPLRAIPFRVVVILGLSDEAFPRGRPAPGFDLMAREPRAGDRNMRTDDRYLFLEALLSARDRLILTAPARDVRDNSVKPQSIVVTELLDALDGTFVPERGGRMRERIVFKHALHAFSPAYYEGRDNEDRDGALPLGVDRSAFAGARARRAAAESGGGPTRRFLDARVPARAPVEGEGQKQLDLEGLEARITRASRYFMRDRLQVRLPRREDVVSELDPLTLEGLDRYALGAAMLRAMEEGADAESAFERVRASPGSPRGAVGLAALRDLQGEVLEIARLASLYRASPRVDDHERTLELALESNGRVSFSGRLDRLTQDGRIVADFTRLGGRGELAAWLRHLFLCACVDEGLAIAPRSVLVGRPQSERTERVVAFDVVESARETLARIVGWALDADVAPLPFFPDASRAFAFAFDQDEGQAWREAHQEFFGSGSSPRPVAPEATRELETRRLWEGVSPLSESADGVLVHGFEALARAIYGPLRDARQASRQ